MRAREPSRLGVWPPLPPDVWVRRGGEVLPFPLEEPGGRLLSWGRQGIWHGVGELGLRSGDEVLVPAYHHGSEVEALGRAGLCPRFYDSTDLLEPDGSSLDRLVGPRTRALHLTHFFGFPQDAAHWRRFCDDRGLLLIEDAAQAWLSSRDGRPVGALGDLAVFSLYKMVGLPEGAAMLTRHPATDAPLDRRPGVRVLARRHGAWLAGRSGRAARALEPLRNARVPSAERQVALGDPDAMPWSTTRFLLRRLAADTVAARRRANYGGLLEALGDRVPPAFRYLPAGASPFLFPVETNDKAGLIERLRRRGIDALDVWSTPHPSLAAREFPDAERRRARTVGVPVHQELLHRDVDRIAASVA